jgi:hypothetical protein
MRLFIWRLGILGSLGGFIVGFDIGLVAGIVRDVEAEFDLATREVEMIAGMVSHDILTSYPYIIINYTLFFL